MEKIQIVDITNELGMKSRDLILKMTSLHVDRLFSLNIKSQKTTVSPEIVQEIFEAVINNKVPYGFQNIPIGRAVELVSISFTHSPIEVDFIKKMASVYAAKSNEHFIVRSFNFLEMDIVRIFTAGLIKLDIGKYSSGSSSQRELMQLLNNLHNILYDLNFVNIDNDSEPLDNLEEYITKHKPQIVYIEGIDCQNYEKYIEVFRLIGKLGEVTETSPMVRFEISFVNLPINNTNETIEHIASYFRR